jgi:hypothetical protein
VTACKSIKYRKPNTCYSGLRISEGPIIMMGLGSEISDEVEIEEIVGKK